MACCGGNVLDDTEKKQNEINKALRADRLADLFKFKVLLLGAGETGKSTIVKQIRRINAGLTSTPKELEKTAIYLHSNVIDCMKALLFQADIYGFQLSPEDEKTKREVDNFPDTQRISEELMHRIDLLWNSKAIQDTWRRRDEFWILDSAKYYFSNLERFGEPTFTPTTEDELYARVRTTGLISFDVESSNSRYVPGSGDPEKIKFKIIDVGGQRSERKKWIHQFDDVKCILFIASLAEYSQVCYEEITKNRMDESLALFHDISKKNIFMKTPMYIILNKKDLFSTIFTNALFPLSNKFPEFKGTTVPQGIKFIEDKYIEQMPKNRQKEYQDPSNKKVFTLTGIIKAEVAEAFSVVKDQLLNHNMPEIEKIKKKIVEEGRAEERTSCSIL